MKNRILVGIVLAGNGKDYVLPKFMEMLDACVRRPEVDVMWSTTRDSAWVPNGDIHSKLEFQGSYVEDMCMVGREQLRRYAYDNGYDKLVWQGVDCLYNSRDDFTKLISYDLDAVGAITTARTKSTQAVAGLFIRDINGITEEHTQFSEWVLDSGWVIEADIPGTDALVFKRNCLDLSWDGKHTPWYIRKEQGLPDLTCEGWYCLELVKRGQKIYMDTGTKTWHVHEDGIGRMWKGIEKPLRDITW